MNAEQYQKLEVHDVLLLGRDGNPGIAHKVNFMWRIHVWLACGVSAAGGYALHWTVTKLGEHIL